MIFSRNPAPTSGVTQVSDELITVLADVDDIPLFRTVLSRPLVPRLLPPTLLATSRRIVWSVASVLLLAAHVLDGLPSRPVAVGRHAVSRAPSILHHGVHLVAPKP